MKAAQNDQFFYAGGTLPTSVRCYVKRKADQALLDSVRAGQFCYVLTSRQMGKSSLMARSASILREEGVNVAIIDLTQVTSQQVESDQWYITFLDFLQHRLHLDLNVQTWWHENSSFSPTARFYKFVRDRVLGNIHGLVVIFIDEIDSMKKLSFRDDFFAALRSMYNNRHSDPEFERLTFVLLGVATPNELIQDQSRTPFNIGEAITLNDFSLNECSVLATGLEQYFPGQSDAIFHRVWHWTNGHPYLTQRLCHDLTDYSSSDAEEINILVDHLVERLFLSRSEEAWQDKNLSFVRGYFKKTENTNVLYTLLKLYKTIYSGGKIPVHADVPGKDELELLGLVRRGEENLEVRNEIYRVVFDESWIKEHYVEPAAIPSADRPQQFTEIWRIIAANLAPPVIFGVLALIVEYNLFLPEPFPLLHVNWIIVLYAAILVLLGATAIDLASIWRNSRNHVRESFSLRALIVLQLGLCLAGLSLASGVLPWTLMTAILQLLQGSDVAVQAASVRDYLVLLLSGVAASSILASAFNRWPGAISVNQRYREQIGKPPGFIEEGTRELFRIIHREEPPRVYVAEKVPLPPILPKVQIVPKNWKEYARELVRLAHTDYWFDGTAGWQEEAQCWVGRNLQTGNIIVLWPVPAPPPADQLERVIAFATSTGARQGRIVEEIVIAIRSNDRPNVENGAQAALSEARPTRLYVVDQQELLSKVVDFTGYRNSIRAAVSGRALPGSSIALLDTYVPTRVLVSSDERSETDLKSYVKAWLSETSYRHLVLLGEYGQGKSTAALMLTYHLLEELSPSGRIPILIHLRGMAAAGKQAGEILGAWSALYGLNGRELMALHEAGRLLIIFDGFDELAQLADWETRLSSFKALWSLGAYPRSKIILTGRPHLFEQNDEQEAVLGLRSKAPGNAFAEVLRLRPFNLEEIAQALRAWPQEVQREIVALAASNQTFLELIQRPVMLHLVASLWDRGQMWAPDMLSTARVVEQTIMSRFARETISPSPAPYLLLSAHELSYVLSGIAAFMMTRQLVSIERKQLDEWILMLLSAMPTTPPSGSAVVGAEPYVPVRARLADPATGLFDPSKAAMVCAEVVIRGPFTLDIGAVDSIRFEQKLFLEYLYARVVALALQEPDSWEVQAILHTTGVRIESIAEHPIAGGLLFELLDESSPRHDPTTGSADPDKGRTAQALLDTILGPSPARRKLGLGLAFVLAFSASIPQAINVGIAASAVLMTIGLLALQAAGILSFETMPGVFAYSLLGALLLIWAFVLINALIASPIILRELKARLRIWNALCRQQQIPAKELHTIVGTQVLPWTRNRDFDLF